MPLAFQRPHQSVFANQRKSEAIQNKTVIPPPENPPEPTELHDFFRFFPLTIDTEQINIKNPRITQVDPLPAPKQALLPRQNPFSRNHALQTRNALQGQPPPQQRPQPPVQPPLLTPPPPTPPPPASPESAAEHFRRVNKSLPDGVMYEPLDDDIMRLLKDNGHIKTLPPQNATPKVKSEPPSQSAPPTPPTIPSEIAKTIEKLSQDERNSQIFYAGISDNAPTSETKKTLTELAKGSETRKNIYLQVLNTQFNHNFTPKETEINTNLPFQQAVLLAVSEENKTLATLSSLLDQVEGTSLERQIERVINKKVLTHQMLLAIYTTTIP